MAIPVPVFGTPPRDQLNMTPAFLQMILDATQVKKGGGKGRSLPVFNALEALNISARVNSAMDGVLKVWLMYPGFLEHTSKNYGWTAARAQAEWEHLDATLPASEHSTTIDRVSGKPEYWLKVSTEFYSKSEVGQESRVEMRQSGPTWAYKVSAIGVCVCVSVWLPGPGA